MRVLRLSLEGAAVVRRLLEGDGPHSDAEAALSDRLIQAGLAHPLPEPRPTAGLVTVAIPARDRSELLRACIAAVPPGIPVVVADDGSKDPDAIAAICSAHGARLLRRAVSGGPAAARNTLAQAIETPLVAFIDSDCAPAHGWMDALVGHFDDPEVAAVAPRIRPLAPSGEDCLLHRYATSRSPHDMGDVPARVRPGGRVSYVPTAALVVRRAAVSEWFDESLRYGEDVDLVWRLHEAGWKVIYEPSASVGHSEPDSWSRLLRRRFEYGTSAASLAERHPGQLAPAVLPPLSTAIVVLCLFRRFPAAAALFACDAASVGWKLRSTPLPRRVAAILVWHGVIGTAENIGRATTMLAPPIVVLAVSKRRTMPIALALVAIPLLREWRYRRPSLDPVRWLALGLCDDIAYGAGVWAGSIRSHTAAPLVPKLRLDPRGAVARRLHRPLADDVSSRTGPTTNPRTWVPALRAAALHGRRRRGNRGNPRRE